MTMTHWKKLNSPDFIGAYALEPGEDLIVTIKTAGKERYTGNGGKKEEGLILRFEERDVKPMICNRTNAKAIEKLAGSPYIEQWTGTKIQLYATEVSAFGDTVDALRIRPFPPRVEEFKCQACGKIIEPYKDYTARQMAENAKTKSGRYLCMDCAKKAFQEKQETEKEGDVLSEDNED